MELILGWVAYLENYESPYFVNLINLCSSPDSSAYICNIKLELTLYSADLTNTSGFQTFKPTTLLNAGLQQGVQHK